MKKLLYTSFILFAIVLLVSCGKDESFPDVPNLEYNGATKIKGAAGKDSLVIINLTFSDGDGDIGLTEADSFPPFRFGERHFFNLFVEFYSIENGMATKIISPFISPDTLYKDTINFSQRIKYLTPKGRNKSIKGKLDVVTNFFTIDLNQHRPDSVYYEIQLFDRKLQQSPIITTPPILLNL